MRPATSATGGCLCGAVRFRIDGELRDVVFCHCTRCRRFHGHVGAYTTCARSDLTLIGEGTLRWFTLDGSSRGFCSACGSSLFWSREGLGTIGVAAGALDEPTGLRPLRHVFVADAGDYYEIADGLERFPSWGT